MKNRPALRCLAATFAFLFAISATMTGNATGAGKSSENCACSSANGNASSTCDGGTCYAICSETGCSAACGTLPGANGVINIFVNGQPVESVCEMLSRSAGGKVSIKYFNESDRNARISFDYKRVPPLVVLENLTRYGKVFVGDVEINWLLELRESIRKNPGQPVSFSFKRQRALTIETFLSFLAGRELHFREQKTGPQSLQVSNVTLAAALESAGLQ